MSKYAEKPEEPVIAYVGMQASIIGLLLTLIILFSFQGQTIVKNPVHILLIAALLPGQLVGYAVVVVVDFDVVIYVCPGLLPQSEFVPCAGQGLQRGLVEGEEE